MNNTNQLVTYAVGGVILIIVLYPLREYLVLTLVSVGAIYIYRLATESKHRGPRA